MTLLVLFFTFFKIGLFTIGGGYAMIPMITKEVVAQNWMSLNDIVDFIGIAESTPGPFAINIATFVGMTTSGILGAVCATLGVVLPSFLIILLVATVFKHFSKNRFVVGALTGLRPTVVGLISAALFTIVQSTFLFGKPIAAFADLFSDLNYRSIAIFVLIFILTRIRKLHPIWIILISAGLGILFFGLL